MLNKKIFAICILAISSLICSQFIPIQHKPLSLELNHKNRGENALNLIFTAEHHGKAISIFRGYAFIFYFPNGSIIESINNPVCSIDNDGNVGSFTSTIDTLNNRVVCVYDSNEDINREGRVLKLNVPTRVTLSGFNLNNTFYNKFKFGLFTAKDNGVLLVQTPAFKSFALYEDYSTMASANSYIITKEASLSNMTNSLSCATPPCINKLYPWSDFSLTFKVQVNNLIYPDEAYLVFKFNTLENYEDVIPDTLDIISTAVETPGAATDSTLYSRLSSSSAGGNLSLENMGNNYFAIKDIARYRSETLANLVPGRTFWITIIGFNTKRHVGNPAITSVNTLVLWKNTHSYLSYHSLPLSSISAISRLNFKTANSSAIDVQASFAENMEGPTMNIYENGLFQIVFQIRVPKSEAGKLIITSLNDTKRVFSFISSTCDFSNSGADKNILGSRQKCIPLYSSSNGLERSITAESSESAFYINLNSSMNSSQDIKFTVWGYANMCNDDKIYEQSYGNILGNTVGTYLVFKLQLEINKVIYAEESSFTSRIKCIKNIRDREFKGFMRFYEPTSSSNSFNSKNPIVQLVGQGVQNIDKDYVLYEEVNDWEPTKVSTPVVSVKNTNELQVDSFPDVDFSSSSFQSLTSTALNSNSNFFSISFQIQEVVGPDPNTIDFYVPLPYTQKITYNAGNGEYTGVMVPKEGRYIMTIPPLVTEPVEATTNGCNFVSFSELRNSKRKYSVFNSTISNLNYKINLTSNTITTGNVNSKTDSQQDMMLYDKHEFFQTNLHTTCFKFKDYKNFQVKNIYTAVSFYLKYERLFSSSLFENRVIRFFKFINNSLGFRKDNVVKRSGDPIDYFKYYSVDVNDAFSANKLCILHIDEALTNIPTGHNTILINLLNSRLPFIGEGNANDYYPISQLNSVANAIPLYTEAPNNMVTDREASYTSLNEQLNGFYDFGYDSYMTPFLGSSIILSGVSSTLGVSQDNEIYIPLYCNVKSYLTIQSYNIQTSGDIDKDTHVYYTFNDEFLVKLFDNHNPTNLVTSNVSYNNVSLRFPDYRSAGNVVTDNLTASNGDVTNVFSSILLTKNVDFWESLSQTSSGNTYFGQKLFLGNTSSFYINGVFYQNIYFMKPFNSGSSEGLNGKVISFLKRVAITNSQGEILVQGVGSKVFSSTDTRVYYSNSTNSKNIVVKDSKKIAFPNSDKSPITVTSVEPIGTVYKSDDGQQFKITIRIFSDLDVSDASLRIHSSNNFNTRTLCVYSNNPKDNDCVRVSEGAFRCGGIKLSNSSYTTVNISCFNVNIGSSGTFSLSTQTAISHTDYIEDNMTPQFSVNFDNAATKTVAEAIVPKVSKYECVQGNQIGALANCFLQLDLGRPLRINQTIILSGAINNLYVPGTTPSCHYMIAKADNNLETLNFFDVAGEGAWFVNSCQISNTLGESHSITIRTRNYVPNTSALFSQNILIRISPVYVINLNVFKYSIQTYLGSETTTVIAAPAYEDSARLNFPAISPEIDSSLTVIVPSAVPGLCNLTSVFPRIPAQIGQMTFDLDLTASNDTLAKINQINGTNKVFNELSIFFDPTIYMRSQSIWCEFDSNNLPCNWTEQGYVILRFGYSLMDKIYRITIKGITIPQVNEIENNGDFLCSVNYYNLDEREQLIVGRGSYTNTEYTYAPENAGNLLFFNPSNGFVSNTTPREFADYSFRFTPDFTRELTSTAQKFEAGENLKPAILVHFPSYYNFSSIIAPLTIKLTKTIYNTDTSRADDTITDSKNISATATAKYNYIVIQLDENPFLISENNAYFDLTIEKIPNPDSEISTPAETYLTILSDLSKPKLILYSYLNLNSNNSGNPVNKEFNNFYLSPNFAFNEREDGLGLIEFESREIRIQPGRYINFNATVKGSFADQSTELSLNAGIFQSFESSPLKLDTGRNRSGTLRIGTSCKTLYGSYLLTFSNSNTNGFYKLSTVRANVTPVKGNVESITLNTSRTIGDMLAFKLPVGGIITVFASVRNPPFEDINFTIATPNDQVNNATFKLLINKINIKAKTSWSYLAYSITTPTTNQQRVNLTIDNRCYGFGTNTNPAKSRVISFNIEGALADLTGINLFEKFRYIQNEGKESINTLKFVFKAPIPNTRLSCALICSEAEFPSKASIESDLALSASNRLANYYQQYIFTNNDINISFENLQRGNFYKLGCYYSNFGVVQAFIFNTTTTVKANIDESINMPLYIVESAKKNFIRFDFINPQSTSLFTRLLRLTQNYANINSNGATITVSDGLGVTLKGYEVDSKLSCQALTAKSSFPAELELQERNKGSLRILQDEVLTVNVTDTSGNEEEIPVEEEENTVEYAQTYWLIFTQSYTDPVYYNVQELVNAYIESVNSVEELGRFVNTDTIRLIGDFQVSEVIEKPIYSYEFNLRNYNYTPGNNTELFFYADGPVEIECDWKLHKINSTNVTQIDFTKPRLSADEIKDCSDENNCGSISFRPNNTELTVLDVDINYREDGSYFLEFFCESEVPQSQNDIVFDRLALLVTGNPNPNPSSSDTQIIIDCNALIGTNITDPSCFSRHYSFAFVVLILISFIIFDV